MFESLPEPKVDAILGLMAAFREDEREHKLDLGVGVYKDAAGKTPVMAAIHKAEQALLEEQTTKSYVAPVGSAAFIGAMIDQVFGENASRERIRGAQAVGGSGALRVLADLMRQARPQAGIWVSDPTWPNHVPLLTAAGFELNHYPYFDNANSCIDIDALFEVLEALPEGDILLLHGCCHNPTGADLELEHWDRIAGICVERSLMPFVDLAYQGFGDGLDQDVSGLRHLAEQVPELAVAASCSKNLGLYRERVGAALLMAQNEADADRAIGRLGSVIRSNYSMPPDHGANATARVLTDDALREEWRSELESMRQRMVSLRNRFSQAMRKRSNSDRFDYIASQRGMFSRLPLGREQIEELRQTHAIYIVGDGRINVAGLPDTDSGMAELADALCAVLGDVTQPVSA